MRKLIEHCPACGGELFVTQMSCTSCETVIQGRYKPCNFCHLTPDSLLFLESFVRNRGNVKEMERELGVSYSTVRGKLNEVIHELGFEVKLVEYEETVSRMREILDQVDRGEIKATEASEMLSQLKQ